MSTDLHTLSGAYALNALSPSEAEEFRKHLAQCQACRDEVRELRQAAADMGAVEAVRPPEQLRSRVLAAAERTAQLPPLVRPVESGQAAGSTAGSDKPARRWSPRLLVAAAAVVVAIGGGIAVSNVLGEDDPTSNLAAPVSQVFNSDDARSVTVETANGGKLRVATSAERDEMAVDTAGLKPLSEEQVYQLWTMDDAGPHSVGVLEDLDSGAAMAMPEEGAQVAITIEPAGGSEVPTTDPIIQLDPTTV